MILEKAAAFVKKDALMSLRYRNGCILSVASPLLQLATLYYLSRAIGPQFRPEGMPYFLFLLVGTGFYSFLLTGAYSMLRSVQEAQQSGTLEVLMTSSTRSSMLLLLNAFSAFSNAFLQLAIYVLAGALLFGHNVRINLPAAAIAFISSVLIAGAIGVLAIAVQISLQKGSAILWALGSSSWLLCGTLFPIEALPQPFRIMSEVLPLTHSLNAMRLALQQPSGSAPLQREIAVLILFTAVLMPISTVFFTWTVQRARQLGTLSYY